MSFEFGPNSVRGKRRQSPLARIDEYISRESGGNQAEQIKLLYRVMFEEELEEVKNAE